MSWKFSALWKRSLIVVVAVFALAPSAADPASAATDVSAVKQASSNVPQDISAARRHRRGKVYVARRTYAYPPYMLGPYDAAPSFGFIGGPDGYPGEYAWRKSLGQCVRDLGYGRWKAC